MNEYISLCGTNMRSPLDLNNLPEDFIRDHTKQPFHDSSSNSPAASGIYRKKKNGSKDERGKVYECRFCSLKFGKSQALGGHMNRHRQERETETLNQARQLVFSTDNLLPQPSHQLGGQHGSCHYPASFNMGSSSFYPPRPFSGTSTTILTPPPPPPPHQHMYTSLPPSRLNIAFSSQYPNSQSINNYFVDHYVSGTSPQPNLQNLGYTVVPSPDGTYN